MRKKIATHGTVYLFKNYICFYSNVFRIKVKVSKKLPNLNLQKVIPFHVIRDILVDPISRRMEIVDSEKDKARNLYSA